MIAKAFNGLRKMLKTKALRSRRKDSTESFEPQNPITEAEIEGRPHIVEEVSNNPTLLQNGRGFNINFLINSHRKKPVLLGKMSPLVWKAWPFHLNRLNWLVWNLSHHLPHQMTCHQLRPPLTRVMMLLVPM